jgi:hypothetical protein
MPHCRRVVTHAPVNGRAAVKVSSMPSRLIAGLCAALAVVVAGASGQAAPPGEHWQVVLVAGDTAQPVFDNAIKAVDLWLAEHGIAEGDIHRFAASARPNDPIVEPATLPRILGRLARLQHQPNDRCLVFITSHGGRGRGIYLARDDEMLRPAALARALAAGCGTVPTVVIVSACYSGSFARGAMAAPNRIVLTAARDDRTSFGCSTERTYTVYDACLLGALPHATTWHAVYDETKACVEAREKELGATPSLPQAWFGAAIRNLPLHFGS